MHFSNDDKKTNLDSIRNKLRIDNLKHGVFDKAVNSQEGREYLQ